MILNIDHNSGARFSEDRKCRYSLWRIWDVRKPKIAFIGLNPSTANETTDDATIRRVISISKNLGFGAVYMLNCFPHISTNPNALLEYFGSTAMNDNEIKQIASECKEIVFAWGNFKVAESRGKELASWFPEAKALHINKNGSPKHPLYCRNDSQLILFKDK